MIPEKFHHLKLKILSKEFEYILFDSNELFLEALKTLSAKSADYFSFSFQNERSLICYKEDKNFFFKKSNSEWSGIKIEGDMPFGTVQGLIATISNTLAEKDIGICVISTFLTDVFLVKKSNLENTCAILKSQGWIIENCS